MKKTRSLPIVMCLLIIVYLVGGCNQTSRPNVLTKEITKAPRIDLSLAKTVGNNTFIPLELSEREWNCVEEILVVKDAFEKTYPNLEVTSWNTVCNVYTGYVFGLWAHHKQKK